MANNLPSHPDRRVRTLAERPAALEAAGVGPFAVPGTGSDDARVDLKLLAARTRHALALRGTAAAHGRLAELTGADLVAGTVQDGVARGLAVALEEALSLCQPESPKTEEQEAGRFADEEVVAAKNLRRLREVPVVSASARVRFTRKHGIHLVDRATDCNQPDCIQFEDRTDGGDLDGFAPLPDERARIFSPRFLEIVELRRGAGRDFLALEGRLGRRVGGFPCRLEIEGRKDEPGIHLRVRIENRANDHRLRIRFYGFEQSAVGTVIQHRGTPGWETVRYREKGFLAATIVRANGRLPVDDSVVEVPAAQCQGWIEHEFLLFGTGRA